MRFAPVTIGALMAGLTLTGAANAARGDVDPIGTWNCVVWGHPEFGDERVLLSVGPEGMARLARIETDAVPSWSGLTPWVGDDRAIRFSDPRTGRQYTADLRRDNLGGTWRTLTSTGGWWCAAATLTAIPETNDERADALPPVLPLVTLTPRYPIQAIREARQGRVVTCFLVDAAGSITNPEIIELSHEMFREPVLVALSRSRYEPRRSGSDPRPSCRSYTFNLDKLAQHEITID